MNVKLNFKLIESQHMRTNDLFSAHQLNNNYYVNSRQGNYILWAKIKIT